MVKVVPRPCSASFIDQHYTPRSLRRLLYAYPMVKHTLGSGQGRSISTKMRLNCFPHTNTVMTVAEGPRAVCTRSWGTNRQFDPQQKNSVHWRREKRGNTGLMLHSQSCDSSLNIAFTGTNMMYCLRFSGLHDVSLLLSFELTKTFLHLGTLFVDPSLSKRTRM